MTNRSKSRVAALFDHWSKVPDSDEAMTKASVPTHLADLMSAFGQKLTCAVQLGDVR
jgi:hypothetical protein